MKKVLIITFSFPPENKIGALRPKRLFKNLPKYGWEPIVLTKSPKEINSDFDSNIIRLDYQNHLTKYKRVMGVPTIKREHVSNNASNFKNQGMNLKKKLMNVAKQTANYPDHAKSFINATLKDIDKILLEKDIDCIISTGPPHSMHLIAEKISKKYKIPFIIDLRDLWQDNPYPKNKLSIFRELDGFLERKIVNKAEGIITVSNTWEDFLKEKYPNKDIWCVRNGYDKEDFNLKKEFKKYNGTLSITYAGTLYGGRRDPSPLFKAISILNEQNLIDPDSISVKFYTSEVDLIKFMQEKYKIEEYIEIGGFLPRNEILQELNTSDILLFLNWDDPEERGTIAGKLYEYFALKKPILGLGFKNGEAAKLINEYPKGVFFGSRDVNQIKDYLLECIKQYENNLLTKDVLVEDYIEQFDGESQAKEISIILNNVITNNRG